VKYIGTRSNIGEHCEPTPIDVGRGKEPIEKTNMSRKEKKNWGTVRSKTSHISPNCNSRESKNDQREN